jgi:hypothetical protein
MSGVGNASGQTARLPIAEWVSRPEALHAALMVGIDAGVRFRSGKRLFAASLVALRPTIHGHDGGERRSNEIDASCCGVPRLSLLRVFEMGMIEQRDNAVRVRVRVQPRASRTEVVGEHDGALKVRVAAPPVDGAANDELVRFIARRVGVARSRIRIVSGDVGRSKVVEIEGVDVHSVRGALLDR